MRKKNILPIFLVSSIVSGGLFTSQVPAHAEIPEYRQVAYDIKCVADKEKYTLKYSESVDDIPSNLTATANEFQGGSADFLYDANDHSHDSQHVFSEYFIYLKGAYAPKYGDVNGEAFKAKMIEQLKKDNPKLAKLLDLFEVYDVDNNVEYLKGSAIRLRLKGTTQSVIYEGDAGWGDLFKAVQDEVSFGGIRDAGFKSNVTVAEYKNVLAELGITKLEDALMGLRFTNPEDGYTLTKEELESTIGRTASGSGGLITLPADHPYVFGPSYIIHTDLVYGDGDAFKRKIYMTKKGGHLPIWANGYGFVKTKTKSFSFVSADNNQEIPDAVAKLLPGDIETTSDGLVVNPELAQATVDLPEGTWTFQGWGADSPVKNATHKANPSADEVTVPDNVTSCLHYSAVGTWKYVAKPVNNPTEPVSNNTPENESSVTSDSGATAVPVGSVDKNSLAQTGSDLSMLGGVALVALIVGTAFSVARRRQA